MIRRNSSAATMLAAVIVLACASSAFAATIVTNFGDGGWTNGDTRDGAGVNVGPAGRLDLNISSPGSPPSGYNSLRLTTATANDKATIHQTGLSLGSLANFSGSYSWYKSSAGTAAPAFKLGINTTDANVASARPGESDFDKFLIYEPYDNPDAGDPGTGLWVTQTFSPNSGHWWLRDRNNATNYNLPYGNMTLNDWMANTSFGAGNYGTLLSGGDIVAIQIGQGSGNAGLTAYVDAAEYTYGVGATNNSYVFGTPVPEPASLSLLGLGGLLMLRRSRR